MIFLFSLFYKRTFHIHEEFPIAVLPSFYGPTDTVFSIYFNESHSNFYYVGLANSSSVVQSWNYSHEYSKNRCIPEYMDSFSFLNTTIDTSIDENWSINIPFQVRTYPIIISCNTSNIDAYVTASFEWEHGYFDLGNALHIYFVPFEICIPLVITGIIFVSIFCKKKSFFRGVHSSIILTCLFSFMEQCISTGNHDIVRKNGTASEFGFVSFYFFDICYQISLFITAYLIGCKWGEKSSDVSVSKVIRLILYSILLIRTSFYQEFYGIKEYVCIPVIVQIAALFAIAHIIMTSMQKLEYKMLAYELVINSLGIKSSTTPLKRKQTTSFIFLIIFLIYVIMRTVSILLFFYMYFENWIVDMVTWLIDTALLVALLLLSFPGYPMKVHNEFFVDDNDIANVPTADFDPMRLASVDEAKDWTPEEPVPYPPVLQKIVYHIIIEETRETEQPLLTETPSV